MICADFILFIFLLSIIVYWNFHMMNPKSISYYLCLVHVNNKYCKWYFLVSLHPCQAAFNSCCLINYCACWVSFIFNKCLMIILCCRPQDLTKIPVSCIVYLSPLIDAIIWSNTVHLFVIMVLSFYLPFRAKLSWGKLEVWKM